MRIDAGFITLWARTLNDLSKSASQVSKKKDARAIVREFMAIGAQFPFDPACTPSESIHLYRRFQAAMEPNEFREVFRFLQDEDGGFVRLQRELGLHMGLFAYVDTASGSLRYLYGPGDYRDAVGADDSRKTQPHFVIKAFYESRRPMGSDVWLEEPTWHFARMAEAFYYSRRREFKKGQAWTIGFAKILARLSPSQMSTWETELGVIYAPSGEIDACTVCWLLLHLDEKTRRNLQAWCENEANGIVAERSERFEFKLTESAVERSRSYDGQTTTVTESHYWGQGRARSLLEWLESLGLLDGAGSVQPHRTVTPKGRALVEWLGSRLRTESEVAYPLDEAEIGPWLRTTRCDREREAFLKMADRAYPEMAKRTTSRHFEVGTGEDLEYRALISAVKLLLVWRPAEVDDARVAQGEARMGTNAARFAAACRMNLHAHLILRAGTRYRGLIGNLPRAWLVFPVLFIDSAQVITPEECVHNPLLHAALLERRLLPVGYFLGTVRDLDDFGRTSPSLDLDEHEKGGRQTLKRRIAAIRALIQPLAEIENRETFFFDINSLRESTKYKLAAGDLNRAILKKLGEQGLLNASVQKDVTSAIASVMLANDLAAGAGLESLSRFTLMRIVWEKVLHDFLHLGQDHDLKSRFKNKDFRDKRIDEWIAGAQRAVFALKAQEVGLTAIAQTVGFSEWPMRSPDIEEIESLVTEMLTARQLESDEALICLLAKSLEFRGRLRHEGKRKRDALAAFFDVPIDTRALASNDQFDCYAHLRRELWDRVITLHLGTPQRRAFAGRSGQLWIEINGQCKNEERYTFSGGYVSKPQSTLDLGVAILTGTTGRNWIDSMVPHYFSPCFLENRNRVSWNCWDLASFVRGQAPDVTQSTMRDLVPNYVPLREAGVRVLVRVDPSQL